MTTQTFVNAPDLDRYVALDVQRRLLEEHLDAVKAEQKRLEATILEDWANRTIHSVKLADMTVYMQRQVWAKLTDPKPAVAAFRRKGLGDLVMVTINSQTLSAWAREFDKEEQPLPKWAEKHVTLSEVFSLRTRRS